MSVAPRHLILNLLTAADGGTLTAREVIAACGVFGIQANNARVTLARLSATGLLMPAARGRYRLGPQAAPLAEDIAGWRDLAARARDWNGDWIAVHVGGLRRSDRSALRARERALGLLGLAEFERGLYLRPDNLSGGVVAARTRLRRLGLDDAIAVFVARELEPAREQQARQLWDGEALTRGYRERAQALDAWREDSHRLPPEIAAREAYRLGNEAIHALVFDPLLPAPMVDTEARQAFVQSLQQFDAAGHAIWQKFLRTAREPAPTRSSLVEPTLETLS